MSNWTKEDLENPEGPDCFCGGPTVVMDYENGYALMCFFHTKSAGAMFPLPKEKHNKWPNLSVEEMKEYMMNAEPLEEED